jgi:hypothetical protein
MMNYQIYKENTMSMKGLTKLKQLRDRINARRIANGLPPKTVHSNPIDLKGIIKENNENKSNP